MARINRLIAAAIAWRRAIGACGLSAIVHGMALVGLGMMMIQAGHHERAASALDAEFTPPARIAPPVVLTEESPKSDVVQASYSTSVGISGGIGGGAGGGLPSGLGLLRIPGDGGGRQATRLAGLVDLALADIGTRELAGGGASFFGITASGNDFVFVVDVSGSMSEGGRWRRAKAELQRSLHELSSSQRFFIIFFNNDAWPMPAEGLQPATAKNIHDVLRWVNKIEPGGGTYPLTSLMQAMKLDPDAIFLLSDGQFNPDVLEYIAQLGTGDAIPIHTIAFVSRVGEPVMQAISRITHGTYRFVH